jgi:hypothetical protein
MPAARAKDMLAKGFAPLAVQNESAATAGLRSKAWTKGDPCPLGEHQLRVRSWGLRRKRARVWRQFLMGGLEEGRVFIGIPS